MKITCSRTGTVDPNGSFLSTVEIRVYVLPFHSFKKSVSEIKRTSYRNCAFGSKESDVNCFL